MSYNIQVTKIVVDYYSEDGEWLDGDYREIEPARTDVYPIDADDIELHETAVAAAVDYIHSNTDACEPSSYPVGSAAREHEWLSGCYQDPYKGHHIETSVRLIGGWTESERAEVFKAISGQE